MDRNVIFRIGVTKWSLLLAAILLLTTPLPAVPGETPPGLLRQAMQLIGEGRNYEALAVLSRHDPSEEELPFYFYLRGKALAGAKRHREAIGYLNRAFITAKDESLKERVLFERGMAYLMSGFHYEASSIFRLFISLYPESDLIEQAYLKYAQASMKTGNFVEALAYFRKVKESPDALFGKAEVFHRLGLYEAAAELYSTGILRYKDYIESQPDVLYYYTENLRINGRTEQAKTLYYLLVNTYLRGKAYLGLGLIEYGNNDMEAAEMYFRKALESPDRVIKRQALLNLGRIYIGEGRREDAYRHLQAIRMDYPYTPEAGEALLLLAGMARKERKFLQAEKYLREILFGRKPTEKTFDELEALVKDSMRHDLKAFREIWERNGQWLYGPGREETLLEVATALRDSGGDFIEVYNYLKEKGSRRAQAEALSRLAVFFSGLGDTEMVDRLVGSLERLKPRGNELLRARAWLAYLKGDLRRAYSSLTRISRPVEDDIELLWRVRGGAPSLTAFTKEYKAMSKATGEGFRYTEIGCLLLEKGLQKRGRKYLGLALKVNPDDERAMYMLAKIDGSPSLLERLSGKGDLYGSMAKVMIKERTIKKSILEL